MPQQCVSKLSTIQYFCLFPFPFFSITLFKPNGWFDLLHSRTYRVTQPSQLCCLVTYWRSIDGSSRIQTNPAASPESSGRCRCCWSSCCCCRWRTLIIVSPTFTFLLTAKKINNNNHDNHSTRVMKLSAPIIVAELANLHSRNKLDGRRTMFVYKRWSFHHNSNDNRVLNL